MMMMILSCVCDCNVINDNDENIYDFFFKNWTTLVSVVWCNTFTLRVEFIHYSLMMIMIITGLFLLLLKLMLFINIQCDFSAFCFDLFFHFTIKNDLRVFLLSKKKAEYETQQQKQVISLLSFFVFFWIS